MVQDSINNSSKISFEEFKEQTLIDYKLVIASREASLIGRREVLTGKAKFGIFGDGKELAQIALARFLKPGDIRSGYYRDQTLMFATGMSNIEQFFAQLYANPDVTQEPATAGRMMNGHYGTRWLDEQGEWKNLVENHHSSSDISPTAGQMVRGLGLAFASKCYRNTQELRKGFEKFSDKGNEIVYCTIGDASTSEGLFWETVNAAGVLQVPLAIFIWDDGYGISVPKKYQTTKSSISECLSGMEWDDQTGGINIYKVKGWDYAGMVQTFQKGIAHIRATHTPAIFHVQELTQPQGHSTSGSQERYKSKERLDWEKEHDCILKLREFIRSNALIAEEELVQIEESARIEAREAKQRAWEKFNEPIKKLIAETTQLCKQIVYESGEHSAAIAALVNQLTQLKEPLRKDILQTISKITALASTPPTPAFQSLIQFYNDTLENQKKIFNTHLTSASAKAVDKVKEVALELDADAPLINGYELLNKYFDASFAQNPALFAFGEDLGKIGDVNQGFAGLQEKYGKNRISDTGIREATIIGQGIGMAMRGLRPIAEIQYLDYLLYGLQPLSDDVATMQYRTKGGQKCPLIVRTRGHRLEGIWHSGSPMGMLINSLRGINLCVPRNMSQASGMYNTLLQSDEPGIVIECLNGYRLKEKLHRNLLTYTIPFGVPEIIRSGEDITIVSYGSTLRIIDEAIENYLTPKGISCEVIDVRTLLPFDIHHKILESLKKTGRIIFIDEDVPSGATAYMFQQVMELQGGYKWLDATPRTLSAQAHRPAYATDGDYFSKPNAESIAQIVSEIIAE